MLKPVFFIIFFATSIICIGKEKADSVIVKNEFIFTIDNSFQGNINFMYSRKLSERLWINVGVDYSGKQRLTRPLIQTTYPINISEVYRGVRIGIDKNYNINDEISFIKGFDIRFVNLCNKLRVYNPSLSLDEQIKKDNINYYGLGFKIGFYYNFSNNFSVGSNLNPFILFNKTESESAINYHFIYSFTNISLMSLKYRF